MLRLRSVGDLNRRVSYCNREIWPFVFIRSDVDYSAVDFMEFCIQELDHVKNAFD